MPLQMHFFAAASLVFARASDSGRHAHRAAQLVLALQTPVQLSLDGQPPQRCEWAVIPPQCAHRIGGNAEPLAHLFVDPGPRQWQHWLDSGAVPRRPDAALQSALAEAAMNPLSRDAAEGLALRWRAHSLPSLGVGGASDQRIAAALARIDRDPSAPDLDHRHLAAEVHVSPSRFLALFREHCGQPVRNYVLWRRLLLAVQLIESGQSVTAAAHAAGFADAAHLSRSVRKVLGAAPSEFRLPGPRSII